MKYTKEQIKEMTDSDINLAVAKKHFQGMSCVTKHGELVNVDCLPYSPCDDWRRAMKIALDYGIAVKPISGMAYEVDKTNHVLNTAWNLNPIRAICEVFLMMDN